VGQAAGLAAALDGGDEGADAPAEDGDVAELAWALRALVAQYV